MTLESQVVSLPLAKRLKELGVKQESLFWWASDSLHPYSKEVELCHWEGEFCFHDKKYAALTVAELGEMLNTYTQTYRVRDYPAWYCSTPSGHGHEHQVEADTEADARAKMLIYLLENNLMSV